MRDKPVVIKSFSEKFGSTKILTLLLTVFLSHDFFRA